MLSFPELKTEMHVLNLHSAFPKAAFPSNLHTGFRLQIRSTPLSSTFSNNAFQGTMFYLLSYILENLSEKYI